MDIRYHKKGSITIKNKDVDVLVGADFSSGKDYPEKMWLANPKLSSIDFGSVPEGKILIDGVGEYESHGVEIVGIKYGKVSKFYLVTVDDYKVGILFEDGEIEEIAEKAHDIDVLVVLNSLNGSEKKLKALVNKTGVNFLVLVGSKEESKNCLDEFDREDILPTSKLTLKSGQEIGEGLEVVLLDSESV